MRKFVFLIAADDGMFQDSNDLGHAYGEIIVNYLVQHNTLPEDSFVDEALEALGISCYRFSLPDFAPSEDAPEGHLNTVEDIAVLVGRGMAFSNQWAADGSVSMLLQA